MLLAAEAVFEEFEEFGVFVAIKPCGVEFEVALFGLVQ